MNFIDTADAYGPHTNETLIAEALYPYPAALVIATKGGLERPAPGVWQNNGKPDYIQKCIDGSLKRLRVERIDLWQLHRFDPKTPIEETLRPVAEAVKAGKIAHVGLSEVSAEQIQRAEKIISIASVQNLYNLGDRTWESIVDFTQQRGMAFIPWFPLASGPHQIASHVKEIAMSKKATVAQIALAWLMRRSENILLIPGTSSIEHLRDNLGTRELELTDEEFNILSKS